MNQEKGHYLKTKIVDSFFPHVLYIDLIFFFEALKDILLNPCYISYLKRRSGDLQNFFPPFLPQDVTCPVVVFRSCEARISRKTFVIK